MSFIWPIMLLALLLLPLFVMLYLRMQAQRRRLLATYGSLGSVRGGQNIGFQRHIPAVLFLLSLAILIFALARPEAVVNLPRIEGTVLLAFDISGSMAAEDLKPTRMEAAKVAAQAFVEEQPIGIQMGVVAFSDTGLVVQPPTHERDAVIATLNRMAPERGTSLGNGILAALNTIIADEENIPALYSNRTLEPTVEPTPMPKGVYKPAVIVLLTDGENTSPPNPLEAAQVAADRGVRIYTIGIGSPAGADLNIEGFTIHTQLNEAMLQEISRMTDGVYYNAENEEELSDIYNNIELQLRLKAEKTEITAVFAGVGIFVLLLGGLISLLWFGRLP